MKNDIKDDNTSLANEGIVLKNKINEPVKVLNEIFTLFKENGIPLLFATVSDDKFYSNMVSPEEIDLLKKEHFINEYGYEEGNNLYKNFLKGKTEENKIADIENQIKFNNLLKHCSKE